MLKKQRNRYEQEAGSAEAILQQKEPEAAAAVAERPQIASNLIEGSKLFSNLTQLRQRRDWEERRGRNRKGKKETVCKTDKVLKI